MAHPFLKNLRDAASYSEDDAFELLERRIEARKIKPTTTDQDHAKQSEPQARTCDRPQNSIV